MNISKAMVRGLRNLAKYGQMAESMATRRALKHRGLISRLTVLDRSHITTTGWLLLTDDEDERRPA